MSRQLQVDLDTYRAPGVQIWAGRERGLNVRNAANIAEIERSDAELTIHVPEDAFAVTSSFLLAFLGDTIRALGETEFRRRVHFTGRNISRVVEQAIVEAQDAVKPFSLA